MKQLLLFSLILAPVINFAQDCSQALLQKKPGSFKTGSQGSIPNVAPADLVKEKSVLAAVHKMLTDNYKPTGCEVSYSTAFGKYTNEGQNWIADPYHYSLYILRFLCDKNSADKSKFYIDAATPTTVNIAANVIYSLNNLYAANLPADDFRGYLKLKQRPVKKDGYYFLGEEIVGDSHLENKIKEYRWLITYNDTLPYVCLSRREYLLIQKKRLEKLVLESPSEKTYNEKFLKNINEYLKAPEIELNKDAVCRWNEEERFEKFVEEGSSGSFIAVKPNPGYYHKKLPPSTPQFFTVVFKIAHGDPVFEDNIAAIKQAVNFAKLKTLLGK